MDTTIESLDTPPASGTQNVVYDGLSIRLLPANGWKRLMAYAIDLGIVYAIINFSLIAFIALALIFGFTSEALKHAVSGHAANEAGNQLMLFLGILFVLVFLLIFAGVYHGYFVYYEYKKGATPGKRLFGLKVISADGSRLRIGQCVLRDLLRYVDCLFVLPGLLCLILNKKKQRLGDMMAGTMVVYSKHSETGGDFLYIKQEEFQYLLDALKPGAVTVDTAAQYLLYAYPRFVTRTFAEDKAQDEQWYRSSLSFMPDAATRGLDQRTALLFFAELCYQTVHKNGHQ